MARWYAAPAEPSWRPSANTGNFWNNMRERRECKQLAVRNEALEPHAAGVRRGSGRSVGPAGRQQNMFAIDWLRRGVPVDTETSVLTSEGAVIAGAKRRAKEIAERNPGREPDSFRLRNATGRISGVFPIRG
jgi:hypothetical protein